MYLNFLAPLAATTLGGVLAFVGSWYGSWRAERQARRERERTAYQAILRLLPRIREALYDELKINQLEAGEEDHYTPATDRLVYDLPVLVTDVTGAPQEVRRGLDLCVEALVERAHNWSIGDKAISTMQALVTAQLGKQEEVATWVVTALNGFSDYLASVHELYEENYRSRQQWEREEREHRKHGDAPK